MDFSKYKFVVSSGCSYGRLADSTFNAFNFLIDGERLRDEYGQFDWLDIDGDKVISINLSLGSQGSDWQSDSLIYVVDKLFKLGINPENIFCLVEWSQWHRVTFHPPHHYGLDLKLLDFSETIKNNEFEFYIVQTNNGLNNHEINNEINFFRDYLKSCRSITTPFNVGKIDDRIYMIPRHSSIDTFKKLGSDYELFCEHIQKVENEFPLENKLKTYLDNILRTQYFLEKNNLKYNFLFMQSTLSEWSFNRDVGIIQHPLFNTGNYPYIENEDKWVPNPNFNPINNPESDIENVMPEIKSKIDQINFNNFWFHESEKFRKGGIDEWVLDNLKETGYINITSRKTIGQIVPNYGEHPNMMAYIFLWNKVSLNCDFIKVKPEFEKFMWDKYWEDYNYNGVSKNNITLSKQEWNKIIKNPKLI
jgi:hypothetical protein